MSFTFTVISRETGKIFSLLNMISISAFVIIIFLSIHSNITPLVDPSCSHLPTVAVHGQNVVMFCCPSSTTFWFSVKWFKKDQEWQLSQQDRTGHAVVYNKEGQVEVDSKLTVQGRLVMLNMTDAGQGWYMCEVTGPAPFYQTSTIKTFLTVVTLPHTPVLEVVEGSDKVTTISCSVSQATTARVQILWYLNGYSAPPGWVYQQQFHTSLLTIVLIKLDMSGKVQVKCVARVDQLYWGTDSISIPL